MSVDKEIKQRNYFPFYDYGYWLDTRLQNEIMPTLLPLDIGLMRAYEWYESNKDGVTAKPYFKYIEEHLK